MGKAKILMVDDNRDIVEIVSLRLEANGYEVIPAFTGKEALEKARSEEPQVILLDIMMPGQDGFEVGRELKADVLTRDIPIIMATARGDHKDILRAVTDAGAVGYVVKPFMPDKLIKEIEKVLHIPNV